MDPAIDLLPIGAGTMPGRGTMLRLKQDDDKSGRLTTRETGAG